MSDKLLTAQYVFKDSPGGEFDGGFNSFVHGHTERETCDYPNWGPNPSRRRGFRAGEKLAEEGKIFFTQVFKHKRFDEICKGHAFLYGGFFVCNDCGRKSVDEPWWVIKTMKDGSAWFVHGLGFEDLQASDNYAFGDTKEEALKNYEALMFGVQS